MMNTVIIMDEDEVERISLICSLRPEFVIREASSREEALNYLGNYSNPADLILFRASQNGRSQVAFCREVQKKRSLPIIIYSDELEQDKIQELMDCEAYAYVKRPFDFTLVANVRMAIKGCRNNTRLKTSMDTYDKVFSIISHDLKLPLATIKHTSQVVNSYFKTLSREEVGFYLGGIEDLSEAGLNYVENLLEWTKTRQFNFQPSFQNFKVKPLFEFLCRLNTLAARQKGVVIEAQVKDDVVLYGDEKMIRVVVHNLLSNAIKFSLPSSKILLSCQKNETSIVIKVKDHGMGMNRETLKLAVEGRFQEISSINEKGYALGLGICHEFVGKNRGTTRFESEPGYGTTVTLEFPSKSAEKGKSLLTQDHNKN